MILMSTYAMTHLGVPYLWSGNDRQGEDCSGLVCDLLRSFGYIGSKEDYTAQQIYTLLAARGYRSQLAEGSVLFFGANLTSITHVAYAMNDKIMCEAGGGGRKTTTVEEARKQNACVRLRPITSRKDLIACIKLPEAM